MRARLAIVLVLAAAMPLLGLASSAVAGEGVILAQEVGEEGGVGPEEEAEGQEEQGTEQQEGQGDPEAETGAEGEGAAEETGPPWTYQMARISLVLLVISALAIGLLYYRLVIARQRGEV